MTQSTSKPRKDETVKDQVQQPEASDGQVRVSWDSSKMKTSYANVCNVSSTREEITLLFGTNQTWQAGQGELSVQLSDRIILSPYAAKRLSLVLRNVIQAYESRFGDLHIEEGKR